MYEKTDKRRIYQLIEMYLNKEIDESTFCYEFYCSYDLEIDYKSLTDQEYKLFYELSQVTIRFSEFEEDIKKYPGVYTTKNQLKEKIMQIKNDLKKKFEELEI